MNNLIKKPCLFTAKEKHGDRYFLVNDDVELAKACIKLIRERVEYCWYSPPILPKEPTDPAFKLTQEDLDALPDSLREDFQARHDNLVTRHARNMAEYLDEEHTWNAITQILDEDLETASARVNKYKRPIAWTILYSRSSYEYEEVEIEGFESFE